MPAFTRLSRKVVSAKAARPNGAGSAIIRICADVISLACATAPAVGSFRSAYCVAGSADPWWVTVIVGLLVEWWNVSVRDWAVRETRLCPPAGGSAKGVDPGDGPADDQRLHRIGALVGVDGLDVRVVPGHVVIQQNPVAAQDVPGHRAHPASAG